MNLLACMPVWAHVSCEWQPYSITWEIAGYGGLIILGIIISLLAVVIIQKQGKRNKKG